MQDYTNLSVWKKSHKLTKNIYEITKTYPKEELYGLTSQIRRACVSVPANIAEGCGRKGNVELGRFLQIAFGSACETEYYLLLSFDLKLLSNKDYQILNAQTIEVKKMLSSLIQKTD
jgi:four helix bundle protein